MADLTRRSLVAGCAAAATLALTGCGSTTAGDDPGGGDADGPADLTALRLFTTGGFTTALVAFRTVPELTLTADGRLLTPDPVPEIYPGPLLLHLTARDVDAAGRAALAETVLTSGLVTTPPPDFGTPGIADAGATTLRVSLDGRETELTADALTEVVGGTGLTDEQRRDRETFRALVDRLRDVEGTIGAEHLGAPVPYAPEGVWLRAIRAPDVRVAEGPAPVVVPWPVPGVDLAALTAPTLVEGATAEAVLDALEDRTELTRFRAPADAPGAPAYEVLVRPALPGDPEDGNL